MGTVFSGLKVKYLQVIMKANVSFEFHNHMLVFANQQSAVVVSRFRSSASIVRLIILATLKFIDKEINNLLRRSSLRSKGSLFSSSFEIWFFSWKKNKNQKQQSVQEYRCFPRVFYFPFPLFEAFRRCVLLTCCTLYLTYLIKCHGDLTISFITDTVLKAKL